jgi:hypothetical protein
VKGVYKVSLPAPPSLIFLLSPAKAGGRRHSILASDKANFELALKFRAGVATLGEIDTFLSGLYFRGEWPTRPLSASLPRNRQVLS